MSNDGCSSCDKLKVEVNDLRDWMKEWFDVLIGRFDRQDRWFEMMGQLHDQDDGEVVGRKRTANGFPGGSLCGASRRKRIRPKKFVNDRGRLSANENNELILNVNGTANVDSESLNGSEQLGLRRTSTSTTDDDEMEDIYGSKQSDDGIVSVEPLGVSFIFCFVCIISLNN